MPEWLVIFIILVGGMGLAVVFCSIFVVSMETIFNPAYRMIRQEEAIWWYIRTLPTRRLQRQAEDHVGRNWRNAWTISGVRFPSTWSGGPAFITRASGMGIDKDEFLTYRPGIRGEPIQLGRWERRPFNRSFFLLNGNGLTPRRGQHLQALLRERTQEQVGLQRVAVIPFAALESAGILLDTIYLSEVLGEGTIRGAERFPRYVPITQAMHNTVIHSKGAPGPSAAAILKALQKSVASFADVQNLTLTFPETPTTGPTTMMTAAGHMGPLPTSNPIRFFDVTFTSLGDTFWIRLNLDYHTSRVVTKFVRGMVMFQPPNGIPRWFEVSRNGQIMYNIHRLGSVVFTARSGDGKRHTFISAFDEQDAGLYFLAQLPDIRGKGRPRTYDAALAALSPPLVHKAREEGRKVYRQGDVFAIQTLHDSDYIYGSARSRVRRDIVLAYDDLAQSKEHNYQHQARGMNAHPHGWKQEFITIDPIEGEVHEGHEWSCPYCHKMHEDQIYNGPEARKALSIYGTGHTADEVVVRESDGATFIRGRMHHDPFIENPERDAPDHAIVTLEPRGSWFLAVRNTVPMQ